MTNSSLKSQSKSIGRKGEERVAKSLNLKDIGSDVKKYKEIDPLDKEDDFSKKPVFKLFMYIKYNLKAYLREICRDGQLFSYLQKSH